MIDPREDARPVRESLPTRGRRAYDNIPPMMPPRWPQYVQLGLTIAAIVYGVGSFQESAREQQDATRLLSVRVEDMTRIIYQSRSDIDVLKCRDGITCVVSRP